MNILESLLYGLISGFAEILPVSAAAHQGLLMRLFGVDSGPTVLNLLIRLAVLATLIYSCLPDIKQLRGTAVRRKRIRISADSRLVRTAAVPLLLGFFLVPYVAFLGEKLPALTLTLLLNGLILYIPSRILRGNKDARAMSGWDSLLIGLIGILGVVPGISRTGALLSAASVRGAERQHGLKWTFLLLIPALAVQSAMDLVAVMKEASAASAGFLGSLLAITGAAAGAFFGVKLLRYLAVKAGFSGFGFYCWGVALFSFVMYLTVV